MKRGILEHAPLKEAEREADAAKGMEQKAAGLP
jgi:hypothetical protein